MAEITVNQRRKRGISVENQTIESASSTGAISEYVAPTELMFVWGDVRQRCRTYGAKTKYRIRRKRVAAFLGTHLKGNPNPPEAGQAFTAKI
jgi:hypothetical protein